MENTIDARMLATVGKAMELRHMIDGSSLKELSGFNTDSSSREKVER
jgi:hypothetical protein